MKAFVGCFVGFGMRLRKGTQTRNNNNAALFHRLSPFFDVFFVRLAHIFHLPLPLSRSRMFACCLTFSVVHARHFCCFFSFVCSFYCGAIVHVKCAGVCVCVRFHTLKRLQRTPQVTSLSSSLPHLPTPPNSPFQIQPPLAVPSHALRRSKSETEGEGGKQNS